MLGFVKTDVEKLNQIVNRGRGEAVDVVDSMCGECFRLLPGHSFNHGKRNWRARRDHRAHGLGNFLLQLFFAADIDVPADQFGSEPDVLAALTNCQAELVLIYDHFHLAIFDVSDAHLIYFRGRKRVRRKDRRLFRPFDDVDFLAAQLANDRLHARTFHTYAGTHRIDVAFIGNDGNLGPLAGLANT